MAAIALAGAASDLLHMAEPLPAHPACGRSGRSEPAERVSRIPHAGDAARPSALLHAPDRPPLDGKPSTTLTFDPFAVIDPREPVHIEWDADMPAGPAAALEEIVGAFSYLGRSRIDLPRLVGLPSRAPGAGVVAADEPPESDRCRGTVRPAAVDVGRVVPDPQRSQAWQAADPAGEPPGPLHENRSDAAPGARFQLEADRLHGGAVGGQSQTAARDRPMR